MWALTGATSIVGCRFTMSATRQVRILRTHILVYNIQLKRPGCDTLQRLQRESQWSYLNTARPYPRGILRNLWYETGTSRLDLSVAGHFGNHNQLWYVLHNCCCRALVQRVERLLVAPSAVHGGCKHTHNTTIVLPIHNIGTSLRLHYSRVEGTPLLNKIDNVSVPARP